MSAATLAAAYAGLHAGHDVGDHVAQTDKQAAGKATKGVEGWRALAGHVASYTACQAVGLALTAAAGARYRPSRVALGLAFSAGTHAFIDRRWPVTALLKATGSPEFARPDRWREVGLHGPYLADQALHTGCLLVAATIIGGSRG